MPQLENGYTQIANEILEKLALTKMNGSQFRILMIVLRSTYGWNKKEHELSETYLSNATGVHRQQIKRELKTMIENGILIEVKAPTFNSTRVIKFNKYYQVSNKVPGSEEGTPTGSKLGTSPGSKLGTQKRNIKNNIKKDENKIPFTEIIDHLNQKTGKNFKAGTSKTKTLVKARFAEGFTVDDFKKVIDLKTREWVNDKHWQKYLRPETLFGTKFESYLNEAPKDAPKNPHKAYVPKFVLYDRDTGELL